MNNQTLLTACSLGLALSLAPASWGQDEMSPSGSRNGRKEAQQVGDPPVNPERDAGLLAGPAVEREAEEGRDNPMNPGAGAGNRRAAGEQNVPLRQWLESVRSVGLSAEQQQKIAAIAAEFQAAQREFQQKHGEEMQQLQQQVRAARAAGKEPDPKIREAFQQLESEMPKQVDCQKRIWDTLTADQQATLRSKLAEAEKRRGTQRRPNAGAAGAKSSGGGGVSTTNADPNLKPAGPFNPNSKAREKGVDLGEGDEMIAPRDEPRIKPQTTDGPMDDEMTGVRPETPKAQPAPSAQSESLRERLRERRRAGASERGDSMAGLDAAARQRVEFLTQHQSAAIPGNAPSNEERSFQFNESQ